MNKVTIQLGKFYSITEPPLNDNDLDLMQKYSNVTNTVLDSFYLVVVDGKRPKAVLLNGMSFEWINYSNIPDGAMSDYVGDGKVLKHINYFDKANPDDNLYAVRDLSLDMFAKTSMYIHPQVVVNNGRQMIDLYVEPVEKGDDLTKRFSDSQLTKRAITALRLVDYVERAFRKDKHRIKKMMPTPEQIKQAEADDKKYVSYPITVKDVTVQYVYEPHIARKYNRHCEAWGVRGHYRHLKNGKVIFIRAHTRGKGKMKDTLYKLEDAK